LISRAGTDLSRRMWGRLYHLGLSLSILVLIASPILIRNWRAINDYYVLNHAVGEEKYVRATEFGIHDLVGHLLFYPRSIGFDHLGTAFLLASAFAIGTCLAACAVGRSPGSEPEHGRDEVFRLQIVFLLAAILGPICVLTVDIAKSPVVGGIVGVPIALLIVAGMARLAPWTSTSKPTHAQKIVFACAMAIFAFGLFNQFSQAGRHLPEFAQGGDLKRLAEFDSWLVTYAREHGLRDPGISADVNSAWFFPPSITANGYERTGQLVEFRGNLGRGIMGVERQEALSLLGRSDFAIFTTLPKQGVYPFYKKIALYWGDLKAWADENMFVARTMAFDNFVATVYARPSARVSDLSGGWITSDGLSIEASLKALQRFRKIRISGPANYSWLPKVPTVSATIDSTDGSQVVSASLQRQDNNYEILVDTSSTELPLSDPVHLHLRFDTFFIPKEIGINGDTRELVVQAPTHVELIR
jgi:hypothetical protein